MGLQPTGSHACCTPWSVFQDGRIRSLPPASWGCSSRRTGAPRHLGQADDGVKRQSYTFSRQLDRCRLAGSKTPAPCRVQAILSAAVTSHAFPPNNFKHFLTLFSKFFSSFPHGTCSLSVSHQYLALDGMYHPLFAAFPNNKTRRRHFVQQTDRRRRGSHPLGRPFPGNLGTGVCRSHLDRPQFLGAEHRRFLAWAVPGSLAVTRGILVSFFSSAY